MADKYRMTPQGSEFIVNENAGGTVGVYKTKQEAQREWKIANGMISCWTQREAWSKRLSRNICECTTLTAKRRTIGLEKRRTSKR